MQSRAFNRVRAVRFGEKQAAGREDFCYFAGGPAIGCGKEPLAQATLYPLVDRREGCCQHVHGSRGLARHEMDFGSA